MTARRLITRCCTRLRRLLLAAALSAPPAFAQVPATPAAVSCPPPAEAPNASEVEAGMRNARDRGFLWRLRKDGRSSYLYGTVHAARRDWMFPGPRLREALLATDTLALELDMLDPQIQRRMAAAVAAQPRVRLPAALQQRIAQRAHADCLPVEALASLPPEFQLATLMLLAARRDGLEASFGIDLFLAGFARGKALPVVSLETPELQVRALQGDTPAETISAVDDGLAALESGRARTMLARIATLWAEADHAQLAGYADWCECRRTPAEIAAMHRMLDDRHPGMAERIDALHREGRRVFAAVGSLHLIGPQGVQALLAQRGYDVERVMLETPALDIVSMWDFNDPARSEAIFRERLAKERGDAALTLRTQIARTYSLRSRFAEAHAVLDAVDAELAGASPEPQVRALLERGRAFRSTKQTAEADPLFRRAFALAVPAGLEYLAIDAMHMIALVEPTLAAQLDWNRRAIAAARAAVDPQARDWEASLLHNIGMSLHDAGRYDESLQVLREALAAREKRGSPQRIEVARWAVAWALRALKRHDEALAILEPLEREQAAAGRPDPYVAEEIAENRRALGR
jgi:uncharacterized protein